MSFLQTSKMMMTAAAIIGIAASPSLAITFNAATDFSLTNNPNDAWQYGWSSMLGSAFNLLNHTQGLCGVTTDSWYRPDAFLGNPRVIQNQTASASPCGTFAFEPGQLFFHPGANGEYAIVRWVAPEAGTYSLATTFTGLDYAGPTTTDVHVLYNGTSLFNNLINGFGAASAKSFATTLSVAAGDIIDFTVGYGSNKTFWYDSTGLNATIASVTPPESVPEPTSALSLLAFGAVGAGLLLKRKQQQQAH